MTHYTYHLAKERLKVLKKELKAQKNKTASPTKAITAITNALQDINNYLVLLPIQFHSRRVSLLQNHKTPILHVVALPHRARKNNTPKKANNPNPKKQKPCNTTTALDSSQGSLSRITLRHSGKRSLQRWKNNPKRTDNQLREQLPNQLGAIQQNLPRNPQQKSHRKNPIPRPAKKRPPRKN